MSVASEESLEKLNRELLLQKSKDGLSVRHENLLYGVQLALALVDGDLNDYLFNATGAHVDALLEALGNLAADDVKAVLEEAIKAVGSPLPQLTEERQAMLLALDDEIIELWDDLTEDYYDIEEEFWNLLLSFKDM